MDSDFQMASEGTGETRSTEIPTNFKIKGFEELSAELQVISDKFVELSAELKRYENYPKGSETCKEEPEFVHMAIDDVISGVAHCLNDLSVKWIEVDACNECPYAGRHFGKEGCRYCLLMDALYYLHGYRNAAEAIRDNVIFDDEKW